MTRTGLLGWVAVVALALSGATNTFAASRPATVHGAERAFVRRGPGTEFTAFATVENGEKVQVEEVTGSWALVKIASGQNGYVHATLLSYLDNSPVALPVTPTSGPVADAVTPQRADAVPGAPVSLEQRNAELTAEVEALRREVEGLRKNPSAVPSPGEDLVSLRAEVRRLADITDALRSRLDAPSSGGFPIPAASDGQWSTSTVTVLAGCALLLGWVIGGVLSRREERGRRNRIRF